MKKRLLSLLLALALAISLLPAARVYADFGEFDLKICGVEVTRDNCEDVLGNGMFLYDYENKTLYLNGGTYLYDTGSMDPVIYSAVDGLTIRVLAETHLGNTRPDILCFYLMRDTVITGDGALYLNDGIQANRSLTLDHAYFYFENTADSSIYGDENASLTIIDSTLFCPDGLAGYEETIVFSDVDLVQPSGVRFGEHGFVDADGKPVKNLLIQGKTAAYQLTVAGVRVSDRNKDDILGDGGFCYEPSTKTLYTAGKLNYGNGPVIYSAESGLTIHPVKLTTLVQTGEDQAALDLNGDTTIIGTGGLGLIAEDGCGVVMEHGSDLTLSTTGMAIEARNGILGSGGSKITLIGTDLNIETTGGALDGFTEGVKLRSTALTDPTDAVFRYGAYRWKDDSVCEDLCFENEAPPWNIEIDGVPVTPANHGDVLNNGVFRFYTAEEMLRGVSRGQLCIRGSYTCFGSMIDNLGYDLDLIVEKQSRLISRRDAVIQSWESVYMYGNYGLECYGGYDLGKEACASVYLYSQDLIERTLFIGTPRFAAWGIRGSGSTGAADPVLVVDNCDLSSRHDIAISGFSEIRLTGCALALPESGRISGGTVVAADGSIAEAVSIVRSGAAVEYDLRVCGVQVTETNEKDILGDGSCYYDSFKNNLYVSGDLVCLEGEPCIENGINGLWIYIDGQVSMHTERYSPKDPSDAVILTRGDLLITSGAREDERSPGSAVRTPEEPTGLHLSGGKCGILADDNDVEFSRITLDINMDADGVTGADELYIERSNVTCGPIYGNDSIFLGDCALVKPEGGSIRTGNPEKGAPDASLGAHIVDADGQLAKYVVVRVNPFEDVSEDKYYYDPIIWAFYHWPVQITNGVDSTHFAPGKTCTRGQIVTFLWRAKDCPEPETTQSPFTDVTDPKAYYYKAVLWAVENGVTSGTDKTHFSPNKPCTRGQVVTFMWRADGSPAPKSSDNPFKDVGDGFYHDAVLWAVEEDITKGVKPDSFAPNATCTRGQIVTFLDRDYHYPLG